MCFVGQKKLAFFNVRPAERDEGGEAARNVTGWRGGLGEVWVSTWKDSQPRKRVRVCVGSESWLCHSPVAV